MILRDLAKKGTARTGDFRKKREVKATYSRPESAGVICFQGTGGGSMP
jgi:hypothetical protein